MNNAFSPSYLRKYLGRTDVYARQLPTGIYVPVHSPVTDEVLQAHLDGKTIGSYTIREDGLVQYVCIDIDFDEESLDQSEALGRIVLGLFPDYNRSLEFSGRRGHHVWLFFEPDHPKYIRELVKTRLKMANLKTGIEVFPKQDKVSGKGYGNLVKLPCGVHQKSGNRSVILKEVSKW